LDQFGRKPNTTPIVFIASEPVRAGVAPGGLFRQRLVKLRPCRRDAEKRDELAPVHSAYIDADLAKGVHVIRSIAHQPTGFGKL
jgi:hypothetical protein